MENDKEIVSSEVDYWAALLNGKEGKFVTDNIKKSKETSSDEDPNGFEKFMVQYRADVIRRTVSEEETREALKMENQDSKNLEEELAGELKFDHNQNEELEQGMSLPESYMGRIEPPLGYNAGGLEEPEIGYEGPSANGNRNYSV